MKINNNINSNQAYKKQYVELVNNKNIKSPEEVPFTGKSPGAKPVILGALIGLAVNANQLTHRAAQFLGIRDNINSTLFIDNKNEWATSRTSGWGENVRVLASNGQNLKMISTESDCYSRHLTDELDKDGINTLEQANNQLSKNGYVIKGEAVSNYKRFPVLKLYQTVEEKYYPLESSGARLDIFNKTDKSKNRFVLVVSQDSCNIGSWFKNDARVFVNKIRRIYDIPQTNIVNISAVNKADFEKGVDSIANKLNKVKNKANSELLILYRGHGDAWPAGKRERKIEGAAEGRNLRDLNEHEVKSMFKTKLKGVKTLFVEATCYSGAWIADNGQKSSKKTFYAKNLNKVKRSLRTFA